MPNQNMLENVSVIHSNNVFLVLNAIYLELLLDSTPGYYFFLTSWFSIAVATTLIFIVRSLT